jgi:fatty-acyl-CoA synthase
MLAGDLLANRARLTPDRCGLVEYPARREHTFATLADRAERIAGLLHHRWGVKQGDRVSILAPNSVAYLDLFFGLARLGAVFVPLNWRLTTRELAGVVIDCSPSVIFYSSQYEQTAAGLCGVLERCHLVPLDGPDAGPNALYETMLADAQPTMLPDPAISAEDTITILYTSGTTGKPKGAAISHRMVLWNCINTMISWELTAHDISPVFTPLFHSGGLFAFMLPLFYAGGRVVITASFDPDESLRIIAREHATVILGVPAIFQLWLKSAALASTGLSNVRWFISGGAPCPVPLIREWRTATHTILRQGYGLTEAGVNCFSMTDDESVRKEGSVGKPIFHSAMRVIGPDGNEVPAGEAGELCISGPHLFSGYWKNPEATALVLKDGWLHTGDMARRDAEGFYTIVGRYKDMIISGGENVYAAEVEAVFLEHPAVAAAALIGQPDPQWGEAGVVIVVCKDGHVCNPADLLTFCSGRLARFKVPKRIEFAQALPVSPYGKVEKSVLRSIYIHEPGSTPA